MPKDWIEIADMVLDAGTLVSFIPRLFGDSGKEKQSAETAEKLIKEGKPREAVEEALQTWKLGFGLEDEMRLLRDVAVLVDSKKLTDEQAKSFMNFLKEMDSSDRRRFREAYVTEKDRKLRLMVIVLLARAATDEDRMVFLNGSGMYDPTSLENFIDAIESPLCSIAAFGEGRIKTLKQRRDGSTVTGEVLVKPKPVVKKKIDESWSKALWAMFSFGLIKR